MSKDLYSEAYPAGSIYSEVTEKKEEYVMFMLRNYASVEEAYYHSSANNDYKFRDDVESTIKELSVVKWFHDIFAHHIASGFKMNVGYHSHLLKINPDIRMLRDKHGNIYSNDYFIGCKSKYAIHVFLRDAIKHNDIEAYDAIMDIPYFNKFMNKEKVNTIFPSVKIPADSPLGEHVFGQSALGNMKSLADSSVLLSNLDSKSDLKTVKDHYSRELAESFGSLIFCGILRNAHKAKGTCFDFLIHSLVKDRADLYCGFKMYQIGEIVKTDLDNRVRKPTEELKEMLIFDVSSATLRAKPVMLKVINLIATEELAKLASDPDVGKVVARAINKRNKLDQENGAQHSQ